ncbi:MAG TPA: hypothetical protein VIK80_14305 [Flavihumibacter sp.]|jgi:hypothetical protein
MKKGLLFLTLAMAILFTACSKEKSVEMSDKNDAENSWQFSLGGTEYKGLIDTAYLENFANIEYMRIEGYTLDGTGQFFLGFGGLSLTVGDYYSPIADIVYAQDNALMIVAPVLDPTFKIVVTELTDTKVAGTFSGTVTFSETGDPVNVTNGRFSARR